MIVCVGAFFSGELRQLFVTCNALQCWWSQLSSKVVGLNQLSNCKVDCRIHRCAQSWDGLSRSLSWSNMQWFITISLVIEHAIRSCSFARYRRSRAVVLCDLHCKWTRSFMHSCAIELLCSCDLVTVKTTRSFMHFRAIKLLCPCDLVAVKTTRSQTSSRQNHANEILIAIRQRLSLPSCLATEARSYLHDRSCDCSRTLVIWTCNCWSATRASHRYSVALKGGRRETAF
jgi:hypothetical protein